MVKKIVIAVWILTATLLVVLMLNQFGNRRMIENYDQGNYQQNELGFLGFTQPYINHFNKGNIFYKLGDYQKAKQEYQLALNLKPDEPYDCKIRVNYALAYVTPIDVKSINEDNYKDVIEICETAKSILAENDWMVLQRSPFHMLSQLSARISPRMVPLSQLWQGTTLPPGVMAMLLRHAPHAGSPIPSSLQKPGSTQPGDVKLISMPFA